MTSRIYLNRIMRLVPKDSQPNKTDTKNICCCTSQDLH